LGVNRNGWINIFNRLIFKDFFGVLDFAMVEKAWLRNFLVLN